MVVSVFVVVVDESQRRGAWARVVSSLKVARRAWCNRVEGWLRSNSGSGIQRRREGGEALAGCSRRRERWAKRARRAAVVPLQEQRRCNAMAGAAL